jgi:hypothetical protein
MITLRILVLLFLTAPLLGQDPFTRAAAGKTIEFREIDKLSIVGTDGNELRVEGSRTAGGENGKAAGLRRISASGLTDNTGYGISVTDGEDGRILVQQVGGNGKPVTVYVPNGATVRVEQSTYRGGGLSVSDFSGPLDVSMLYHRVELDNVTGPLAVSTVYDDILAVFERPPTEEVRLHSTYSDVDLTLPPTTAADLRLYTGYGSMFTDFDILVTTETRAGNEGDADYRSPREVKLGQLIGTINGGGPLIALTATYDNLYIRKK